MNTTHNVFLFWVISPLPNSELPDFWTKMFPGIHVPHTWVEALETASLISPEEEYRVGFELSKTLFEELKALHPKIHIMTANQFELAKAILS